MVRKVRFCGQRIERVQIAIAAPSLDGARPLRTLTLRLTSLIQSHIRLPCVLILIS